ncbi:MAG: heparinase II/III family protein [Planctomycetota bacterium]|nr:heparinase II/III family protein [Planctomycetota bacterium]
MDDRTLDFRQRGFLPPQYLIYRLPMRDRAAWQNIPPLPCLVDLAGRRLRHDTAAVRLAWGGGYLWLQIRQTGDKFCVRPDIPAEHPDFWRQDHIELRCLLPGSETRAFRLLVVPNGRFAVYGATSASPIKVQKTNRDTIVARLPLCLLALPENPEGEIRSGIVAQVRWQNEIADIACSSAAELGFDHAERWGEFIFAAAPPAWYFTAQEQTLTVFNRSGQRCRGLLRLTAESDGNTADRVILATERVFPAGKTAIRLRWPCTADRFERYSVAIAASGRSLFLGSFTRRACIPRRAPCRQPHPYLLFSADDLPRLRDKVQHEPWRTLAKRLLAETDRLYTKWEKERLAANSFDFTPGCLNWFRVAKETMLGRGQSGSDPAAARLWQWQSEEAREAWREIVRTVEPKPQQMAVLLNELNRLLRCRDLYDPDAFARVRLPSEARALLRRGLNRLPESLVVRFNRILLQSAVECIHNFRMDLLDIPARLWERWLATADPKAPATATAAVAKALDLTILGHEIHLHEGMAAGNLALAYDSFAPLLGTAERRLWQMLLRRFLELYLETAGRRSWTVTTIANANPVGNGGCGLAALAMWREAPALARRSLYCARENIRSWLDYCNGPHGGNTEGAQYWQYGMENFLRFALALERTTGSDDGLLNHPAVKNMMNMIRLCLTNDGALHGVNDTIPMPIGGSLAWFAASRWGDALGLWYGDHAWHWLNQRRRQGKTAVYGCSLSEALLYRPLAGLAKKAPALPTAICLPDIQYATIRSAPRWDAAWVAGLKGSRPPYTHHNQPDTGSMWLDVRGERLLIDPGYYKEKAEYHSLPLIGGVGPKLPHTWTGRIFACESQGNIRYLACDSTAAYDHAQRVHRHLLLVAEEALIILDDIVAAQPVTLLFQCGAPTAALAQKGAAAWLIKGIKTTLAVACFSPGRLKAILESERTLHDVHWGYHFADCRWFPVRVAHRGLGPIVTIVAKPQRVRYCVRFHPDRVAIALGGQRRLLFALSSQGWLWLKEDEDRAPMAAAH